MRLLLLGALLLLVVGAKRPQVHDPGIFEFTAPSYNLSISEKWTVNATAWSDGPEKIGVYVPGGYNTVKFKIVKGDKDQIFQPIAKRVGNFAFLSIAVKSDQILNRELQDEFIFVIKATTRRKNDATHEAQATVYLRVMDDNDLFPFFKESEYAATVDDQFPVNGKIVQLEGVDADIGLNGQIYYSLLTPSSLFYIEPLSGWVRSYNKLTTGTYALTCQVEDRASRLHYQRDASTPFFQNQVPLTITVTTADNRPPKLSAQPIPLKFYTQQEQPAALLTVSGDSPNVNIELSNEVQLRGDTFLRRQTSNSFLLSVARVTNSSPGPVSLIVRDLSQPNATFTAENIQLEMNATNRRAWFNGTTDEDTPRIRIRMNESAPTDYLIYTFNAMTTYPHDQKHIKYRIHGKESQKLPFHLDKTTGQLRVKSKMSFAQKSLYEISVVAKLEGVEEKAFIDVFLEVLDSNDNCPQFKNLPDGFQLKLKSNKLSAEIYKVMAEDADAGINAQLSYKLIGINGSDSYFSVDPQSGSLKVIKELPSAEHKWLVKLMAIDAGQPLPQFATTLLQIVYGNTHPTKLTPIEALLDTCSIKNEHSPKFLDAKTTFEASEDAPIGYEVGKVQAIDKDYGYNGFVQYTTTDSYFGIDVDTGNIFVQRTLDSLLDGHKKDHLMHEIEVIARDQAVESSKSANIKVQIRINDVNNHAPEFEKFSYIVHVSENTIPSEELLRLKATDKDSGVNGRIEYRLAVETDTISVDPDSGLVRLERALDREQQDKHRFLLMAVDRGQPPKIAFTNLTIVVDDLNDNAPLCAKLFHLAELAEDSPNGQLVICVAAHDADQSLNAQLNFEMSSNEVPFRVDQHSGCIFTNLSKPMDYEVHNSYAFNVTVLDSGTPQMTTTCPIEIMLVDINENQAPRFTEIVYEAAIEENRPKHTELLTVKAVDSGGTSIVYELIDGDGLGYLELDRSSGVLRTATVLDYERDREFWLTVRATDSDKKAPLSGYAHIYIKVLNMNDQRPLFSEPIYFPTVVENSEPNKVIVRLNATDGDVSSQLSTASPIRYSIERGNQQSHFVLDENTGYLVTGKKPLDRETQREHELYIQACDRERECSTVLVVVTVLDQNDNKPQFKENSFNLTVAANQAGYLTRVFAFDLDEDGPNSDLTYSLEDSTNNQITIDKFGRMFATQPLSAGASVQLTVVAEDSGEPRMRSSASVRLTAVAPLSKSAKSNQAPSFQNRPHWHHLYVSDHDEVGTILGRIEATDPDNDPLWFQIVDETTNPNETFAFQSSGELVLARRAELIGSHLRKIELTISVSDGFAEIRDKVFIHVTRSSLSRPRFEQTHADVEIGNEFPVGYVLYATKAHFDQSNTGVSHPHPLSYAISYVTDVLAADSLRVDSSNGNLILERPLNEAVATNFSVIISARIGGGQENFAVVNLHKKSVNHPPKFLFDEYRFDFDPTNSQIGSVLAIDIDSDENGQIKYSVLSGNEDGYFALEQDLGELTLRNSSTEMASNFTLTIRAVDSSKSTPLSSTCTVYLKRHTNEKSDGKLTFKNASPLIVLDEKSKGQQTVTTLDVVSDSFVTYSADCDYLNVHFASGLVQLRNELGDAAFGQTLNCTFVAVNTLTNHTAKFPVHVKTVRRDNTLIRFDYDQYESVVREQAGRNSPLFTNISFSHPLFLHANILNSQSQSIRYRLLSPQESFFAVNSTSGVLNVAEPIDFEMYKNWNLYAIAHDTNPSNPKASQPVQVQIQVVSTNKRPPKFVNSLFEIDLLLPTAKGTLVGQIKATDIDTNNNLLRYSLRSSSKFQSLFQVNAITGQLHVATNNTKSLEEREYKLDVQVSDGVHVVQGRVMIKTLSTEKFLRRQDSLKLVKQQYVIHVTENRTSNVDVQRPVLAIDWPLNANSGETFDFRIATETNNQLLLDSTNGLFYLNSTNPLDREQSAKFDIVLLVTSRQNPQRYAQAIVQVNVDDINDCAPQFDRSEYLVSLPQNAKLADRLLQAKAVDLDLATNGIVRYSLANDAPDFVEINANDGRLLVRSQPTEEQLQTGRIYQFHIIATDQGTRPLNSKAKVQMQVTDQNQPIFTQSDYKVKVSEAAALESPLIQVQAKSNSGGEIVYQIIDGDPLKQFEIRFRDGRLLLNSPLDREQQNQYLLRVQALDLSRQNVSVTAAIDIQIEDVNDSAPEFENDIYKYSISENAPIGTLIGQLKAVDSDLTPKDNKITYQLVNDKKSILSIDQMTGEIRLANFLDYEREKFMEWTVVARDSDGLTGEAIIQLNILDENDNVPVFIDKSPLRLNIQAADRLKEPRFIHEFKANDLDTVSSLNNDNKFVYFIVDGDDTLFDLNSQNGILTQIRPFDATELSQFADGSSVEKKLNISVNDGFFATQLQTTIVFKPTASQIGSLQFNSLINTISLSENLLINNRTVIDVLKVHGGRRPFLFSTPPTNGSWPFFVHPTNGQVFLAKKLDCEHSSRYVVPFTAQDANQQLAFMLTEVNIQQSNDNAPKFVTLDSNGYQLYVSITAAEEDRVAKVMAVDQDEDDVLEFAMVDFEENSWLNPTKYFTLDSTTGHLIVQAPIPANLVGQELEFAVKVTDQSNPPHQHKVSFQLHITDAPVPHFSRLHFYFAISEESELGTLVGQLTTNEQTSKDVQFEMQEDDEMTVFALDKSNGRLTLRQKLDRETKEQHQFVVSVQNSQGFKSFCFVTVTVIDANDNQPMFVTQIDRVFVREDVRPGSIISVFHATDADQGANGRVRYKLTKNENEMFKIDSEYGWLFVTKPLDREQRATYNLTIVAQDDSNLSTEWPFQLIVRDVNDSPPVFEKSAYELKLNQANCQVGQKLLRLNVNDPDTTEVQTLTITIVSNEHDNMLKLTGNDLILNSLPTTNASFNTTFNLIAFDGVHSTAVDLQLQWTASNQEFCSKKEKTIRIPSNRAPNSTILLLNSNRQALIHHLLNAEKLPFEIVNNSELVVKEGFYKLEKYELQIKSIQRWDNTEQSCVHRYNVAIEQSNRMRPHFDVRNFTVNVSENSDASDEKRQFLIHLSATDEDFGRFGQLTFELMPEQGSKDADNYFAVHQTTGAVLLKKPLDRESHEKFDLRIRVTDGGGLSDIANLTVIVDDLNDNIPAFAEAVYHLNVLENEAVGYVLLKLTAHDNDIGSQKLTYALEDKKAREFVELDAESGVLRLIQSFDYEQIQAMTFEVIVRDNGQSPLESKAIVELKVLDINDNAPRFEQTMYEGAIAENQPIGTKILKVLAKDLDSQHFGKVSYSLSGEDAEFLVVTDDGWVELAKSIDYEVKKLIRANIKAQDGGMPPLIDEALLSITVQDVNDHAPVFAECQLSAVVQEGVQAGQSLLTVQLIDEDSAANAQPFRLEIRGDGASAFTFDPMLNLITTRQLSYSEQKEFHLNVTAFDSGDLSTTCPLTILVKRQSVHPPETRPLLITLSALYGEFLVNGKLGRIRAVDKDQADLLRYSIIEAVNHAPSSLSFDHSKLQSSSIHVDATTGDLSAVAELLPGLHRFNISVTDGKFVVHTPVTIDVGNIDQDALDNSISVQMSGLTADKFVKDHMEKFVGILSRLLSVPLTYVRILSVQDVDKSARLRRALRPTPTVIAQPPQISNSEIELLLTVSRGESRGFHRPSFVKQRISEGIAQLTAESGLEISSLTTEICRSDTCSRGECRDRLWLDNVDLLRVEDEKNGNYYMFPKFLRTFECICAQGFSGQKCNVASNKCSREMCTKYEMCVPNDNEPSGFNCACPPGLKGDRCVTPTCEKASECSQKESISLLGNGYFQLFIAQSLEARMELLVEFKTVSRNAYLMHGAGPVDFHSILIDNGYVEYRWNCGSGLGQVKIPHIRVDDGQWHTLKIMRRGRQVKLMLDNNQAEGASPPGSDVVNLYSQATILTFGAQLMAVVEQPSNTSSWMHHRQHYYGQRQTASELANRVENGTIGCFRRIGIDGTELPKMDQGLRLYNARIGCDTQAMGACLNGPCLNNGQCVPKEEPNAYSCICSERYTGTNCEIDLNSCASNPCPVGIPCHNLYNDFHCSCPHSFTGKTCQIRGDWDPCITSPCGQFGTCVRYKSSFICNCSLGYSGQFCMEKAPKMYGDNWSLQSPELYILFGIFLAAFLCALLAIIVCRRQNKSAVGGKSPISLRGDSNSDRLPSTDDPTNALIPPTPRIAPPIYQNTVERPPPPIPPKNTVRVPRSSNHTLLSSGLPMVEVHPMQSQRLNGHVYRHTPSESSKGSFSSAKMSAIKGQNPYDDTYEEGPKPAPPPHKFLIDNDENSALLARGVIVKNPLKKEKNASNPATSMSSLDNASSSGDYLTMKPVKKKNKEELKKSNGTTENGVHKEETGEKHS